MKRIFILIMLTAVISSILYGCSSDTAAPNPDFRIFYSDFDSSRGSYVPYIYDFKTDKITPLPLEKEDGICVENICGYEDGEYFCSYKTKENCEILKIRNGKIVSRQGFIPKFKVPSDWEFNCLSVLSMERFGDGVLVLSPDVDVYADDPFYADVPSTLYYVDFSGKCEPILENIVSFRAFEDKICYVSFDETRLVEYGETTVFSKLNINIYENGKTTVLFPSDNCPYESVEGWCSGNELLLMRKGKLVKYNFEAEKETELIKPTFYYSFEEGKSVYVSDRYVLAAAKKQDILTLDSDVSYLYLFDTESGKRYLVSEEITGTYCAPFEIIF